MVSGGPNLNEVFAFREKGMLNARIVLEGSAFCDHVRREKMVRQRCAKMSRKNAFWPIWHFFRI
jgi:hypothetical protein